jgi:hypothetical protein
MPRSVDIKVVLSSPRLKSKYKNAIVRCISKPSGAAGKSNADADQKENT